MRIEAVLLKHLVASRKSFSHDHTTFDVEDRSAKVDMFAAHLTFKVGSSIIDRVEPVGMDLTNS